MILSGKKKQQRWKSFSFNCSLIMLFLNKKTMKMKTQNVMACSYHSKVTSTQNKGISFFFCLGHGVQLEAAIQRCSIKRSSQKFRKIHRKHLHQSLFLSKVAGLRSKACIFIKKRLWHRYFHINFAKFLRTPFLIEHLWWLHLFSITSSKWLQP